ncbi:hypothetical protein RAH42_09420 [Pyramidobacter sp. YE332]|uniref:hypothetical protein n=1 Tax=Pyramidobacter sp. YE332 TaxID=3068894 RepID=UPI00294B32FB|nr:hypothetical protein [Pyramidobacter sp. YE332]WOL39360.1 hypothetical protein RAH42_09420 [Pyramidobacter sp. YE332]
MDFLERLSRWVGLLSLWFGGVLLLINIGDIVMGVVLRYFYHAAPSGRRSWRVFRWCGWR